MNNVPFYYNTRGGAKGQVAFGLTWHGLQPHEGLMFDDARHAAREHGFTHGCVYKRPRAAIGGFWPAGARVPSRPFAAAIIAAKRATEPTLYIHQLPDGRVWLCHVQKDQVLAPTREAAVTNTQAKAYVDEIRSAATVPSDLAELTAGVTAQGARLRLCLIDDVSIDYKGFATATRISLEDFLAELPPEAALQAFFTSPIRIAAWIGAAAAFVLSAWGGLYAYRSMQVAEEATTKGVAAEVMALRARRIEETVATALAAESTYAAPHALLADCAKRAEVIGERYFGWRVTSTQCDPAAKALIVQFALDLMAQSYRPNPLGMKARIEDDGAVAELAGDLQAITGRYPLTPIPQHGPLNMSALPNYSTFLEEIGNTLIVQRSRDPRVLARLGPVTPRILRFNDPTKRDPATQAELEQDVPVELTYRTIAVELTLPPYTAHVPFDADSVPMRIDRIDYLPDATRTTITFIVGPQP